MGDWEFVKDRTATQGAVLRSSDGLLYKRTGGEDLREETDFQQLGAGLGYPVPEIVDRAPTSPVRSDSPPGADLGLPCSGYDDG